YTKGTTFPNWALSGTADYTVSNKLLISGRAGRYYANVEDFNVNNQVRFVFADSTTNIGQAGVPENFQHPAGYSNIPSNNGIGKDTQTRNFAQFDATYFASAAGQHQIKGGVQIDRRGNDVINGNLQNVINIRWDTSLGGVRGPFGYYEFVSSGPTSYQTGFATAGNVQSNVNGIFVQDQWAI